MRLLISNDDGIDAKGIGVLAESLADLGEVWVVAPDRERSAISHAISLHHPLRARRLGARRFGVDGTPADCVYLALNHLLPEPPDIVVSGINRGGNLGNDVLYSGTVAAAMEGALFGFRAVAFSVCCDDTGNEGEVHYGGAASFARALVPALVAQPLAPGTVLNVNAPNRRAADLAGFKLCRLGYNDWADVVTARNDPRGRPYYWIGGERAGREVIADSDYAGLAAGYVTVTPIHFDLTDHRSFWPVRSLALDGFTLAPDGLGDEPLSYLEQPRRRP